MKKVIVILLVFLMVGCGALKEIEYVPYETVKTEYVSRIDTTIIRDSVYLAIAAKRDTVFVTKEKYKYVTKIKRDTLYKCDTIPVIKEVKVDVPYIPDYYKKTSVGFWLLMTVIMVIVGWKVYKIIKK